MIVIYCQFFDKEFVKFQVKMGVHILRGKSSWDICNTGLIFSKIPISIKKKKNTTFAKF